MATTITAPVVPAAQPGQQNVQQYPQSLVGEPLPDITGASTTAAGSIKIEITAEELDVRFYVTAATNAYTTANKFSFVPEKPGLYTITVTDVTAAETVEATVEVFEG